MDTANVARKRGSPMHNNGQPYTPPPPTGHRFSTGQDGAQDPDPNRLIVEALDNTAFDLAKFPQDWIIENMLVRDEPIVLAGASKSMKTAIAVDAAISLASGKPFLGAFKTSTPMPVYVISAESGPASLQSRMRHVCSAKGIKPAGLPIQWYTRVELLSSAVGQQNLAEALTHFGSKVCILDPSYLLLAGEVTSDSAGNMFSMGALLASVGAACQEAGATCIVATHANGKIQVGEPMELAHIAWSGFQQWARQWWLISRRTKYDDDGKHALFLRYGGSAGHTGLIHVDIDEGTFGDDEGGKRWCVETMNAFEARKAARAEEEAEQARQTEADSTEVLKAMIGILDDVTTVASRNAIKDATGLTKWAINLAITKLVVDGAVIEAAGRVRCGNTSKPANGIRRPESWSA